MEARIEPRHTRQTGRTTKQIEALPPGSLYITNKGETARELAKQFPNRGIVFMPFSLLENSICGKRFTAWDYEHQYHFTPQEAEKLREILIPCLPEDQRYF